jgi:hypothetical protein
MTKDEIYEHLAKVYLGKKKKKKKQKNFKFYTLLFINVVTLPLIAALIVGAVNSRFLKGSKVKTGNAIQLSLNAYPLRISYDFKDDRPQVQDFVLNLPDIDVSRFSRLEFLLRAGKRDYPRLIKLTLQNKRRETSFYYLSSISHNWQRISIPLSEFKGLNDFSNLTRISFGFESWNQNNKSGSVLIEDLGFSGDNNQINRL